MITTRWDMRMVLVSEEMEMIRTTPKRKPKTIRKPKKGIVEAAREALHEKFLFIVWVSSVPTFS